MADITVTVIDATNTVTVNANGATETSIVDTSANSAVVATENSAIVTISPSAPTQITVDPEATNSVATVDTNAGPPGADGNFIGPPSNLTLQQQLDQMSTYGFTVAPIGVTEITETLNTGNKAGGTLRGYGAGSMLLHVNQATYSRAQSYVVCGDGWDDNTPAIDVRGRGFQIDGVQFLGDNYNANQTNWQASEAVTVQTLRLATAAVGGFSVGSRIRSLTNRTTGSTFDASEAANWETAGIPFRCNLYGNRPFAGINITKDIDNLGAGKSAVRNTFIQGFTHAIYAGEPTAGVVNWQAGTSYSYEDRVLAPSAVGGFSAGQLILSRSTRTSSGTWDSSEAANWISDANVDNCLIEDVLVWNCENFLTLSNAQNMGFSVNHSFYANDLRTAASGRFLNVLGGGDFSAHNIQMPYACTMIELNQAISPAGANTGWGPNNGTYVFNKVKVDDQAFTSTDFFRLMNMVDTAYDESVQAHVYVNNLQLPTVATFGSGNGSGKRLANLRGLGCLTIANSRFSGGLAEAFEWHTTKKCVLNLVNCDIHNLTDPEDVLPISSSTGDLIFTVQNCRNLLGEPIDDWTYPVDGAVTGTA